MDPRHLSGHREERQGPGVCVHLFGLPARADHALAGLLAGTHGGRGDRTIGYQHTSGR